MRIELIYLVWKTSVLPLNYIYFEKDLQFNASPFTTSYPIRIGTKINMPTTCSQHNSHFEYSTACRIFKVSTIYHVNILSNNFD